VDYFFFKSVFLLEGNGDTQHLGNFLITLNSTESLSATVPIGAALST
jgi:hypothetical protein